MRRGTLNRSRASGRSGGRGEVVFGCRGGRPASSRVLDVLEFRTLDDALNRMLLR